MRVLVVGAGPAGLASAIAAAERGAEVRVFEKRVGPLDKACGEGIMPQGTAWLVRHGVDLEEAGRPFVGIRYVEGERVMAGRFFGAAGRAVRRTVLSERLLVRARGLGVDIVRGAVVDNAGITPDGVWLDVAGERISGDLGVAADGLHGRVSGLLGAATPRSSSVARYGIRFHVERAPWTDHVEVHWSDHGEAYVTPVGDDEIGVAFLSSEKPLNVQRLLSRFPLLQEKLIGASMRSQSRGAGPLGKPVGRRRVGNFGLVGDSSGYVDACTGEGLSLAFVQASAWIECAMARRAWAYEWHHRRIIARYALATRAVLLLARFPQLRRPVFSSFERFPPLFRLALNMVT
ncbi:MAG: FAD-dependent monooxygenase [Myxococcota bacterium]